MLTKEIIFDTMFLTKKGRAKMLVYHGSKELFTEFSYSRIGTNGTTEGQGFYFTDNLQVAKSYSEKDGYVYEVDFMGKKSFNSDRIDLKRSEIKKILIALHSEMDILSNWDDVEYYGLNKVLNMAIENIMLCNSDVEIYGSLCNITDDIELISKTFNRILGYDSIVLKADWANQNIYIAIIPEIIKIINVNKK